MTCTFVTKHKMLCVILSSYNDTYFIAHCWIPLHCLSKFLVIINKFCSNSYSDWKINYNVLGRMFNKIPFRKNVRYSYYTYRIWSSHSSSTSLLLSVWLISSTKSGSKIREIGSWSTVNKVSIIISKVHQFVRWVVINLFIIVVFAQIFFL